MGCSACEQQKLAKAGKHNLANQDTYLPKIQLHYTKAICLQTTSAIVCQKHKTRQMGFVVVRNTQSSKQDEVSATKPGKQDAGQANRK
jgi:hypothetical protein